VVGVMGAGTMTVETLIKELAKMPLQFDVVIDTPGDNEKITVFGYISISRVIKDRHVVVIE
jgi:hypothetical protein